MMYLGFLEDSEKISLLIMVGLTFEFLILLLAVIVEFVIPLRFRAFLFDMYIVMILGK